MLEKERQPPKVKVIKDLEVQILKYPALVGEPTDFSLQPEEEAIFEEEVKVQSVVDEHIYVFSCFRLRDGRGWVHGLDKDDPSKPSLAVHFF